MVPLSWRFQEKCNDIALHEQFISQWCDRLRKTQRNLTKTLSNVFFLMHFPSHSCTPTLSLQSCRHHLPDSDPPYSNRLLHVPIHLFQRTLSLHPVTCSLLSIQAYKHSEVCLPASSFLTSAHLRTRSESNVFVVAVSLSTSKPPHMHPFYLPGCHSGPWALRPSSSCTTWNVGSTRGGRPPDLLESHTDMYST